MRRQESYWTFKAPDTPEFSDLPAGAFGGTEAGWNSLSPGYRREIYRSAMNKVEVAETAVEADLQRMSRANEKYEQGMVAIKARETL